MNSSDWFRDPGLSQSAHGTSLATRFSHKWVCKQILANWERFAEGFWGKEVFDILRCPPESFLPFHGMERGDVL